MQRHPLSTSHNANVAGFGQRRFDREHCQWSLVVGDRIRRLRLARGWHLRDLAARVVRPDGEAYSVSYFSKIERGWATAPLYAYLAIAAAFDMDGGRLLGADAAMLHTTEAEATLLKTLRELGIEPHEALALLLAQARSSPIRSSRPSIRVEPAAEPSPS